MAAGLDFVAVAASRSSSSSPFKHPDPQKQAAPKSPPLAFAQTPNDTLVSLFSPPESHDFDPFASPGATSTMGGLDTSNAHLQNVVDKQSAALQALHTAFAAERDAWSYERQQLYQRVSNLEKLLRAQNGHSPAKSPIVSPTTSIASPQSRATTAPNRLPSIAEDENIVPLSQRRENAPQGIPIPTITTIGELATSKTEASGAFADRSEAFIDELRVSPPRSITGVSPPPPEYCAMAGHTPLKAPVRPATPPPKNMNLDGIEDTPTRNNTHINTYLTRSDDEEEDKALSGPLNMPELPGQPSENNFTEEMLFKKLEKIAQSPDTHRPSVFSSPSPGLAEPFDGDGMFASGLSPNQADSLAEIIQEPNPTREQVALSEADSRMRSPIVTSPPQIPLSQQPSRDASEQDQRLEQGGIKLKKKPSSNFGAPFGQLGGLAGIRKLS